MTLIWGWKERKEKGKNALHFSLFFSLSPKNPVMPNEVRHLNTKKATLWQPFLLPKS
jgi:hypothetical protein